MTKSEKIRLFYGIFLGALTVVVGLLFIFTAADIYYSGEGYSREIVTGRLLVLLAPVFLWILAIIAGFVLSVLFPDTKKRTVKRDGLTVFGRLKKRIPTEGEGEFSALYTEFRRGELVRLSVRIASGLFCLAAAIACLVYLCTAANFSSLENLNRDVLRMLGNVLPWVGAALLVLCAATVFESVYAKKTLPSVKKMVALGRGEPAPSFLARARGTAAALLDNKHTILALRFTVLAIGLTLLLLGIFVVDENGLGGAWDTLVKATKICTECIGLG